MIRRTIAVLVVVASTAPAGMLFAQERIGVRSAVLFESYSFDAGLPFTKVSQLTIPIGIDVDFGRLGKLTISTGFVSTNLTSADRTQIVLADQTISSTLDAEFRFNYNLVPGKLILIANGALPTGTGAVAQQELSLLGAISSDVIGFSSSDIGSGGEVGGGFAAAFPVGRFAIGVGGTFTQPISYTPVTGDPDKLSPGSEFRLRTGFEGPLTRTTYIRFAGIFAARAKDEVGSQTQNGVGGRFIGYLSLNHGIGSHSVTVYGFDVFRSGPRIEPTAVGAAVLPRGNLYAVGGRVDLAFSAFSRKFHLIPRFEVRRSFQALDANTTDLERTGSSVRFGSNLLMDVSRSTVLVLEVSGITGSVVLPAVPDDIHFDGYRTGVRLEWRP